MTLHHSSSINETAPLGAHRADRPQTRPLLEVDRPRFSRPPQPVGSAFISDTSNNVDVIEVYRPRHQPPLYVVGCDTQSAGNGLECASVAASSIS